MIAPSTYTSSKVRIQVLTRNTRKIFINLYQYFELSNFSTLINSYLRQFISLIVQLTWKLKIEIAIIASKIFETTAGFLLKQYNTNIIDKLSSFTFWLYFCEIIHCDSGTMEFHRESSLSNDSFNEYRVDVQNEKLNRYPR